ncbi:MAG TPA: TadE family protein [Candidatus Binatia bacterium]|nr:TadE family protein [Candidatus Binatia bacterium]
MSAGRHLPGRGRGPSSGHHVSRRAAPERGQSLVEFAFTFPLIALLAFAFIDIGRAAFQQNTLADAAREAARVAAVNQVDPADGPWQCFANKPVEDPAAPGWTFRGCAVNSGATIGVTPPDVTITYVAPPGTSLDCASSLHVGCIARVTVVSRYVPITPVAGQLIGPITMSATSEMPIERLFP